MFSLPLISFFSFFTLLGRDGSPTATLQRRPRRNFLDSRFLGVAREARKEIFGKTNSARDQTNVATAHLLFIFPRQHGIKNGRGVMNAKNKDKRESFL